MRLPLVLVITTHSLRSKSRMCCYFYSLYCMYIIANKATFMAIDIIMAIIKNNIKLINTTSLSDSKSYLVKWQHISTISFPMLHTILHILQKSNITYKNWRWKIKLSISTKFSVLRYRYVLRKATYIAYCVRIILQWWAGMDSNHRRRKPTDLQSAPFSHSGTPPKNSIVAAFLTSKTNLLFFRLFLYFHTRLVRLAGIEPTTLGFGGQYSIHWATAAPDRSPKQARIVARLCTEFTQARAYP